MSWTPLHRREHLVAAIHAKTAGHLAWVGVYPLNREIPTTRTFLRNRGVTPAKDGPIYRVRVFEVAEELIAQDACIAEPDLLNRADWIVQGDDELLAKLKEFNLQIEDLQPPFKTDYPI